MRSVAELAAMLFGNRPIVSVVFADDVLQSSRLTPMTRRIACIFASLANVRLLRGLASLHSSLFRQ